MHYKIRYIVVSVLLLVLCSGTAQKRKPRFINPANMDNSVSPGENFYLYANGNWLKNNPVPASKTSWGSFTLLHEDNTKRLKGLLEETAKYPSRNSKYQKIGDFYSSSMDSLAIERLGHKPVMAHLERIASISDLQGVVDAVTHLRTSGIAYPLFGFYIGQDRKRVDRYIPQFTQGGITLPDRDYYFHNDARSLSIRKAYADYISNLFQLTGTAAQQANQHAETILRLETALAKAQMPRVEMRDPQKTYNKFSIADFSITTPSLDWRNVLQKLKIEGADSVTVNNPAFFKTLDILLTALPVADWRIYLQWNVLKQAAPYLNHEFVRHHFQFTQALTGQKKLTPRWQRMSSLIDNNLGELLGELYVERYFKPEAKQRMLTLVTNLEKAFEGRLKELDWMSDETKKRALEKLASFTKKIGYPEKWRDYSSVTINRNDFLGNIYRTNQWAYEDMINRFGKPIDKTLWGMTPPTINAYYNSVNNEIAFPAGILQFPFFDFDADDAINYGGIGAVIGHEIIHGFDDSGRQYAADGNLKEWWTKEDAERFTDRANKVVELYESFTVLDTLHVNGKLTLGENIADIGGLAIAYEAFKQTRQFKEGKTIDGFTPAQRFFLSWAQIWRINMLPETQAQRILTDPHSPGMYRVNGPLMNMDEFYQAFAIKEGDKMYVPKEKRIRIW